MFLASARGLPLVYAAGYQRGFLGAQVRVKCEQGSDECRNTPSARLACRHDLGVLSARANCRIDARRSGFLASGRQSEIRNTIGKKARAPRVASALD